MVIIVRHLVFITRIEYCILRLEGFPCLEKNRKMEKFSNRDSGTLAPGPHHHWIIDSKMGNNEDCQKLIRKSRYEMTSGTSDLTQMNSS